MKLDENFRIETFNQLLLRYNNGLGKHPVLESKRRRSKDRLLYIWAKCKVDGLWGWNWTVQTTETGGSYIKLDGHIANWTIQKTKSGRSFIILGRPISNFLIVYFEIYEPFTFILRFIRTVHFVLTVHFRPDSCLTHFQTRQTVSV